MHLLRFDYQKVMFITKSFLLLIEEFSKKKRREI